jgi:hypothetical protein
LPAIQPGIAGDSAGHCQRFSWALPASGHYEYRAFDVSAMRILAVVTRC